MKTKILYICVMLLAMFASCTDDWQMESHEVGEECWVTLDFGHQNFESIEVLSRYALSDVQESLVNNLYVYVFSSTGERVFSHYFDASNKKSSTTAVSSSEENCWYVSNRTTGSTSKTNGSVKMKVPEVTQGKLFLIANVDNTTLRVSSDKLSTIKNLTELQDVTAYLAEEITARTPGFLMVAEETVNITKNSEASVITIVDDNDSGNKADLVRLDAKVEMNVKVAEGDDATTEVDGVQQTVKAFVPKGWQVMNIPRYSNLTLQNQDYETTEGYFNSSELHFEKTTYTGESKNAVHSFAFYMLENRETAKNLIEDYHKRDVRIKNADGSYNTTNGLWANAPEMGTYMVIKGEVQMEVSTQSVVPQLLVADVVYYIHLGDVNNNGVNDYNVNRNTHYTYNVTIKGVNSIEVEVKTSELGQTFNEPESGVTGNVYKAEEEIYTFDAHYGQRVYRIKADNISVGSSAGDEDYLTWYVKTPFGREGSPREESGTSVPDDLDYKWVHFMLNKMEGEAYSQHHRAYPGDGHEDLMDVIEFMQFLREEKRKLMNGQTSAFVNGELYVTVFVDEFYYESHPITGVASPTLWKSFVNQPNRLLHLLCDHKGSKDGASSMTGSVITIRQRSIQTPYDPNIASLQNAWGVETVDEYADSLFFFYDKNESLEQGPSNIQNSGNTSRKNGLYNTAKLLGLKWGVSKWEDYLNYEDPTLLENDKKTLLYSVLVRNRDNDGDGCIDADELRWYISSIEQLYGIYIGELGIDDEAKLYREIKLSLPITSIEKQFNMWREHLVSSTQFSSSNFRPIVLWAEEGVSVSWYRRSIEESWDSAGPYTIRCFRNLGLGDYPTHENIEDIDSNVVKGSDELIQVEHPTSVTVDSQYKFNLMNVNETSLRRIYYEGELPPSDENSTLSAPYYKGFITGNRIGYTNGYANLKRKLENGESLHNVAGYRIPNIRELALMYVYCDNPTWWGGVNYLSASYFSLGTEGTNKVSTTTTWYLGYEFASLGSGATYIRLVKDIE